MGCHSRSWMILIDIIGFSNDLRGVRHQGTRIGWPRLDSSFVYRAKQPGLGGKDGDLENGYPRHNFLFVAENPGLGLRNNKKKQMLRLRQWGSGWRPATLMLIWWSSTGLLGNAKLFFSKWPTGHWPARGKAWFLFFFTCIKTSLICKVPLIGSNASPPGWASTGGALGLPTRNRMVSYNQSWFEDGRSTCCQHLPWFAMPSAGDWPTCRCVRAAFGRATLQASSGAYLGLRPIKRCCGHNMVQ